MLTSFFHNFFYSSVPSLNPYKNPHTKIPKNPNDIITLAHSIYLTSNLYFTLVRALSILSATSICGCFLANFKPNRGDYAADNALYTVEAKSYWPNDYGLYNMAGNVSEVTESSDE